jgi:hypothetical protein
METLKQAGAFATVADYSQPKAILSAIARSTPLRTGL